MIPKQLRIQLKVLYPRNNNATNISKKYQKKRSIEDYLDKGIFNFNIIHFNGRIYYERLINT